MSDPNTEGYWCRACGIHRTRSATGLCPSCDDVDKHPERLVAVAQWPEDAA